jgi:hypothetical protein
MSRPTIENVYTHKKLPEYKLFADLKKLMDCDATQPNRCFAGNAFLYHHQIENLCNVRINGKDSLHEIMIDQEKYTVFYQRVLDMGRSGSMPYRIYEAHRFNGGAVFFKPTTAKYICSLFPSSHMLDPTAGWGGRMLGAWAAGCSYTGFDTNIDLKPAYEAMMADPSLTKFPKAYGYNDKWEQVMSTQEMRWENFLTADISGIDYDLVLTSPPYINKEMYPHMPAFESKAAFYTDFLVPLINKCRDNMKRSGWVCINISPPMYTDLTIAHKYPVCDRQEPLLQQKRLGKDKADMIYCWRVIREAPVVTPVVAAVAEVSAVVSGPSYSPA